MQFLNFNMFLVLLLTLFVIFYILDLDSLVKLENKNILLKRPITNLLLLGIVLGLISRGGMQSFLVFLVSVAFVLFVIFLFSLDRKLMFLLLGVLLLSLPFLYVLNLLFIAIHLATLIFLLLLVVVCKELSRESSLS